MINEPTHILGSSPCIDLILKFGNRIRCPSIFISLFSSLDYFCKIVPGNSLLLPSLRDVWHYQDAILILDEQLIWLIGTILSSFIPHETLTIDDKDPPWFTKKKKKKIESNKSHPREKQCL